MSKYFFKMEDFTVFNPGIDQDVAVIIDQLKRRNVYLSIGLLIAGGVVVYLIYQHYQCNNETD